MKLITIMYDSLNRNMLSPYGCEDSNTEQFSRLAGHCTTFDNFYAGSLPCMPARREMHTGRYNFLHRSWGPLEPYDNSVYEILSEHGIYTHFISDHAHYWQEGGLTYHTKFSSYEFIRGQEGDAWKADVRGYQKRMDTRRQDHINRTYMKREEDFPHVKAFNAAMEFLEKNREEDNWCLHLEYFDPHEPFHVPNRYKKMATDDMQEDDWPPYAKVGDSEEQEQFRRSYCSLLNFCDVYLGKLLDFMDEYDMWKDTMLIVNTDHGFLLGEHGYYAKNYMPVYQELAHLPFFIWDPVSGNKHTRNKQLSQTIDIAPTILDFFGMEIPGQMQGKSLLPVLREGTAIRKYALFGYFGKHVNITDGNYVYMRAGRTDELYNYTVMPTHIFTPFSLEELSEVDSKLYSDFKFSKGAALMKVPARSDTSPNKSPYCYDKHRQFGDLLFDVKTDPEQNRPIRDEKLEAKLVREMRRLMEESEAPEEQFRRLGIEK